MPPLINEPIAIDGKTLSGLNCHLLSAFAHHTKSVLFEIGTDTKGKEIPLAHDLLAQIPVKGHIITADALHTQKQFCQKVTDLGGGYCLTAKGNQHYLEADINLFFSQPPFKSTITTALKTTKAKGQLTTHTIEVSNELNDYLSWPGVTHTWRLTRQVTHLKTNQTRMETVVGITRLLNQENPEEQIIDLVKGHWSIENRLHRQRDAIFLEDKSTIRKDNAPQVFAALKNLVISIYHGAGVRYFPTAFRRFLATPEELFALLGLTNLKTLTYA
jgi:predicted transposase YbfD/YdcC